MEEESLVFEDATGALALRTVGVGRQSLQPFSELPVLQKERGTNTSRGEWLYPLGSGLGQGWTLSERPAGGDPLQIVVEAPEAELALWENSQGVDVHAADGSRWTYSGIQAEDADGTLLPAWMEVDGSRIRLRVDDAGARWPIRVDPVVTTAANSIAGSSSSFLGQAVAGGDVNGDGYDDFLVSAYRISTRGAVYVYLGSASGIGTTPATTLYPATSGQDGFFGWEIRAADFNADGYADAAVSEPEYSNGSVYIFMGSSAGLNATAAYVISGSTARERNGYALAVGDYDADGYDDLVSTNIYRNTYGAADVYYGSVNGLTPLRLATLDQSSSFHDMGYCADAGDVNGDGYDDLVVGHYESARYYGEMFVYMGSATGLASTPAATYVGPEESISFGLSVAVFGDVNGDGYEDVGMGASRLDLPYGDSGAVYMYYGSSSGIPANPNTTLYGTGYGDNFGRSLEAAGDTNADGYADAIIGSPYANGGTYSSGSAKIFPGSAAGLVEADADRVYAGTTPYESYASEVGGVGDLNGDGFDDVAVGHPDGSGHNGAVYVYVGTDGTIDDDGDGYFLTGGAADCDDTNNSINPGATELCDGVDQDCDGVVDDGVTTPYYADSDGDSYGDPNQSQAACALPSGYVADATDCNDADTTIFPGATEQTADSLDQDCDRQESCYEDQDGDHYGTSGLVESTTLDCSGAGASPVATDCDDNLATVYPGAAELPGDGVDQDCDAGDSCFVDNDGDTQGGTSEIASADLDCLDAGEAPTGGDCDDSLATIYTGANEQVGDGVDQDCDGQEGCYLDADRDLYGSITRIAGGDLDCLDAGEAAVAGDCNDLAPTIYPGATEIAGDGVDEDCDGGDLCYVDADGDTFGDPSLQLSGSLDCSGSGEASVGGDCDDANPAAWPGATELAGNATDEDCDGQELCYVDADQDGVGSTETTLSSTLTCDSGGLSWRNEDCDDADPARSPDQAEVPADGVDQDCDSLEACYVDEDGDSYGDRQTQNGTDFTCTAAGSSERAGDCDHSEVGVNPMAEEVAADAVDQNCDGEEDCYVDADGDGHGISERKPSSSLECVAAGVAPLKDDCDDTNGLVHPEAEEKAADGIDQDCDGGDLCYIDWDGDSYGSSELVSSPNLSCVDGGEATSDADCDDTRASSYPGAAESCNGNDDNCDGTADEDLECEEKPPETPSCSQSASSSPSPLLLGLLALGLRRRRR